MGKKTKTKKLKQSCCDKPLRKMCKRCPRRLALVERPRK